MQNITLICTRHKETGACNSIELLKIIERYQPEVIFEELRPTRYDAYYTPDCWGMTEKSLETDAIKQYLQYHDVKHIPALSTEMKEDFRSMRSRIANRSLNALIDNFNLLHSIHGFRFLNSDEWGQKLDELKLLEKSFLKDDEYFLKAYQCVDEYERNMLDNIYNYSAENKFLKALMFIGAAHRNSIIKKIQEYQTKNPLKVNWLFYNGIQ